MDTQQYDKALRSLGVCGPTSEMKSASGAWIHVYTMPDGSRKYLTPGDLMTPEQRQSVVDELHRHLNIIAQNRQSGRQVGG